MTFAQPFSGYEILAKVGSGAMGTVFKARQKKMDRIVALKVLRPSLARNEHYVARLRREARIVGSLNHPNIVAGFDIGEEGGYHYFVMELVDGNSLKELLTEWGMFPESQVLDVAIQVAEALDHAYQRGIIHRDIKPGNILIDQQNVVKLSDMGLAKGPTDLTLTRDGATVGTPQYISPEQARNPQEVDVRSDLYSLGATIFHMATGSPPFRGESIGDLIAKVLSEREPWAREINPLISEGLNLVIRKLLAKDPNLRYQNPAELLADLRRVRSDERPEVDPKRLDTPARQQRKRVLAGSLAAVVLVLAMLWAFWPVGSSSISGEDPDESFRLGLRQAVAQAGGFRAKFAVVERIAVGAEGPVQEQMGREKRADLSMDLSHESKRFLDSYLDQDRIAWLGMPGNWRETEARFFEALDEAIGFDLGYQFAELPPRVRTYLDPTLRSLLREVADLVVRRDRSYLQGYLAYLQDDLEPAVDHLLDESRYIDASRELAGMLGSYHGSDGRPDLEQLPQDLFRAVSDEMQLWDARLRRRIIRRQGSLVGRMLAEIGDDLAKMRARLSAESDPQRLRRDFDGFAAEIVRHYPAAEAFTADIVNPWEEINAKVRRLDRDIHREIRSLEQDLLAEDLAQAYRSLLVEGEAGATIELLRTRSIGEEGLQEDRRSHVDLLTHAIAVRDLLFRTLLGERSVVDLRLRGRARVRLHAISEDRYQLTQEGTEGERPVFLVHLDLDQVLTSAGIDFEREVMAQGLHAGLAFWRFVGGLQRNKALGGLPQNSLRRFFMDVLAPLVEEIRGQISNLESGATVALAALRKAVDRRDLAVAERNLQALQSSFAETQVARSNRRNLHQLRQWVEFARRRARSEDTYRQLAPRGARVHVDAQGHLELNYAQQWILDCELPRGWSRGRGYLHLVEPSRSLSQAVERSLQLPLLISSQRSYEIVLKMRLSDLGLSSQMLILSVGDIHAVVALLPIPGRAFAVLRRGPAQDGREDLVARLRRKLQDFESSPEILVEGGIHELRLNFDVRRERVFISIRLEGHELATGDFPVVGQASPVFSLSSMQEMALYGISLREF